MNTWSESVCEVKHLEGLKPGYRVSVANVFGWVDCCHGLPGQPLQASTKDFADVLDAMEWGEEWAQMMGAYETEAKR